jgi:hypothetical protein
MLISVQEQTEMSVVTMFFCYSILNQIQPLRWSIVVKEKPNVYSPFFGAFPSDRIRKATKDVSVQKFPSYGKKSKLYPRIKGTFRGY